MTSSPASASSDAAFAALHPNLQRWIWQQGWPSLRPVQRQAIPAVLARDSDVLITAPTAGGKTEAAFLPILTDLTTQEAAPFSVLAVSPLRALITDQAHRITAMAECVGLRVQPWHSDVTAGKSSFWKRPTEILITTPESLEAMLMRRGRLLARWAPQLRYLVIDELHAFPGTERGAQLVSLLDRVERLAGGPRPRIGLSATLGDPQIAARFLRHDRTLPCRIVEGTAGGGELRLQVRAVYQRSDGDPGDPIEQDEATPLDELSASLPAPPVAPLDTEDAPADRYLTALSEVTAHLYTRCKGGKQLVFANSRNQVELVADQLRARCEDAGLPNEYFAHHGTLSKDHRKHVEERLREGQLPTTAVCTSTLELGIDVGTLDQVGQVGAPPSVAALKQRVGRSGRRKGQAQTLRSYVILPDIDGRSHPIDWLRLPLVQTIAVIDLMLESKFEPPAEGDLHLSTLVQQLLSIIAQHSGISVPAAYQQLIGKGAFAHVDKRLFLALLQALHTQKVVEQHGSGSLLLGPTGEQITSGYEFYAAFQTPDEFLLLADGKRLGSLPIDEPITVGQLLVFAGRRWQVTGVSERERVITVIPSRKGLPPKFSGSAIRQHAMVHARMREVLAIGWVPDYLDEVALGALRAGQESYRALGLTERFWVPEQGTLCLGHWQGSRIGATLSLLFQSAGWTAGLMGPFVVVEGLGISELPGAVESLLDDWPGSPVDVAQAVPLPLLVEQKWDGLLSEALLREGYAARHIDLPGARAVLEGWASTTPAAA